MLFRNIDFYNTAELIERDGFYTPLRVPASVQAIMSEMGRGQAESSTGSELRFRVGQGGAKLKLKCGVGAIVSAIPFYGDFQSDWPFNDLRILGEPVEFEIKPHPNAAALTELGKKLGHRFPAELVRIILPSARIDFIDASGDIEPPRPGDYPEKRLLCYGSSITHGSLAIGYHCSYPGRVARSLGMDLIGLGFAGSACLEREMADHIAQRGDFDVATLEMGINILGIAEDDFARRVDYFVNRIHEGAPDKYIFAIDLFTNGLSDTAGNPKIGRFRDIVRNTVERINDRHVIYADGSKLLSFEGLSSGLVHPSSYGHEEIARRLTELIKSHIE